MLVIQAIFNDGHHRQLPRLTSGPLKYKAYAYDNFKKSVGYAKGTGKAMKTAVIAPSMLYLLYPLNGTVEGYSREKFVEDLVDEVGVHSGKTVCGGVMVSEKLAVRERYPWLL